MLFFMLMYLALLTRAQDTPSNLEESAPFSIANLSSIIQVAVSNHDTQVVIPPGVYRGKTPFLTIKNATNLSIVADGVTMLCETRARAVQIENCQNLTLKGLTIDYYPLTFTQGDIIAVGSNYVDVKIHAGYAVEPYSRIDVIDPVTRFRKRGSKFIWNTTAELRGEGIVRVFEPGLPSVAEVGDMATMSTGPEGFNAPHALVVEKCLGEIVLEDVTIHSAPGFGLFEHEGLGGTVVRNCRIVPGEKPEGATEARLLTTSWDAIQHSLTKTGPLVEGCTVRDAGDDSWSVTWEGTFSIQSVFGDRMTVNAPMSDILQTGDTLRTSLYSKYAVIVRKSGITIFLDRDCPWGVGTKLYSPNRRCENFTLRNNHFRSSGRVLIKAGHGLIENNIIEDGHCGVIVNSESDITAISHLTIRNNDISGTGHFMPASYSNQAGSLSLADGNSRHIAPVGSFDHIVIENNTFSDVSGVNVVITSAKNVSLKGNRFYNTGKPTPNDTGADYGIDQNAVVYLKNIETMKVDSNAVIKRGLNALLKQANIAGLTLLRGGIFDSDVTGIYQTTLPQESEQLSISPSSGSPNETVNVTVSADERLLEGTQIEIYNLSGLRVAQLRVQGKLTPVVLPPISGIYIMRLSGGKEKLDLRAKVVVL